MFLELLVLLVAVIFVYRHFSKYNNYWKERNVPGPKPTFFFGNIKDIALRKRSTEIYKEMYDKYPDEKIIGVFRMRTPVLLVKDLDIIKHILIQDFESFTDRDMEFNEDGLGGSLLAVNGDTWRALRHRLTPIFTSGKLKNMMNIFSERADKLVEYVDKITRDRPDQEIHGIMKKYTQASVAACLFGLDIDTFNSQTNALDKLEFKIFVHDHRAELEMMYPGILKRLRLSLLSKDVTDFFSTLTKDMIAQRNGNPTGRNDLVDLMLGLRKAKQILRKKKVTCDTLTTVDITDGIMASQIFIFFIAGYQPTSLAMSFMLYYLAFNPKIQEKVHEEISKVLQKHEGKLTYQAVLDMKYLGQVFDETMRLHPIADTLRRVTVTDYKIPSTGLTVKKGQIIIIPISSAHMDTNNYVNPEIFDPDRFLPENVASRHSCAYLPFGLGPRHCIAVRFAKLLSRAGIARLLSAFRVEPSDQTPQQFHYRSAIIQYPLGRFPLKLIKRVQ